MAPLNRNLKNGGCGRMPKMTTQTLLDFDLEESSSDSDFRIEDHDESDDFSDADEDSGKQDNGNSSTDDSDSSNGGSSDDKISNLLKKNESHTHKALEPAENKINLKEVLSQIGNNSILKEKNLLKAICCVCLGDRSDDSNEIVECDGCGVLVHEGCYGISESTSISSTVSSCSTEPWFCEACRANVKVLSCELCPNKGGIYKETDVGKWVHLVCALYVPGVAFGEVDQLSSVTLFEMPYNKWGTKSCSLCEDDRFARTGVCIGCDAGMCKSYFHVTCAQAAGFLAEAHSEEADHADPFYAHCKIHSDKTLIKHRKRNFHSLQILLEQKRLEKKEKTELETPEQQRIKRKLLKYQIKYKSYKIRKTNPWVPTQKISRLLTTSATACRRLMAKANVMDIDTIGLEFQEAQMAALADIKKKWHIQPAFSVEFVGYYLDRISRVQELKTNLQKFSSDNEKLLSEQKILKDAYEKKVQKNAVLLADNSTLKDKITEIHGLISKYCPNKVLPVIENIGKPRITVDSPERLNDNQVRPISVPTAAALKMGVGFPLTKDGTADDTGRILSTQIQNREFLLVCGICKRCNDQHLLAKCDTCNFYYHLGCLNPPLQRHPKKSKLYGWQCSECDKSDNSDGVIDMPRGPRKSRTRFSKDGIIIPAAIDLCSSNEISNQSDSSSKRKLSIDRRRSSATSSKTISTPTTPENIKKAPKLENDPLLNGKIEKTKQHLYVKISKNFNKSPVKSLGKPFELKSPPKELQQNKLNKTELSAKTATKSEKKTETNINLNTSKTNNRKLDKSNNSNNDCTSLIMMNNTENKLTAVEKISNKNKRKNPGESKLESSIEINSSSSIVSNNSVKLNDTNEPSLNQSVNVVKSNSSHELVAHKQNRKRRKDKHRNRSSFEDTEKPLFKEHKRKRKKKSYDIENPNDATSSKSTVPKIKIKFKTLPLPGEVAPEPQFFYVSADMVRATDASRPTSVETIDDSTINNDDISRITSPVSGGEDKLTNSNRTSFTPTMKNSTVSIKKSSPKKPNKKRATTSSTNLPTTKQADNNSSCHICHQSGTNQNSVMCDECLKVYHFTCLEPPVKKTPKRRGYSWHCADCDPTVT